MLSLAVIDDEYYLRLGIHQIIDWDAIGITIVGEGTNGEEGLALIRKSHPDMILLDIQMPIMNGLALMECLKEECIDVKIVVLSGFNDFEYAQIALKNGAVDYLLKPVSSDKLMEAMLRTKDIIMKERDEARHQTRLDREIPLIRQQFLRRLLLRETITPSETAIKTLGLPPATHGLLAVSVQLDQYPVLKALYLPDQMREFESQYEKMLNRHLSADGSFNGFIVPMNAGRWGILLLPTAAHWNTGEIMDAANTFCRRFLQAMEASRPFSFSIGISDVCPDITEFGHAYQAASAYAAQKFLPGVSNVSSSQEPPGGAYRQEIRNIIGYIRKNYFLDITVNTAAKELYISSYHLMHLLKKELGMTFNTCLSIIRISAAQKLLAAKDNRITETAQIIGYNDVKYFSRVFKKLIGVTPAAYCTLMREWPEPS